jgi:threonine dehydrogenase-like Zn-dependent dehydrogenase
MFLRLNWKLETSTSCVLYDITDLETSELMRSKNRNALTIRSKCNAPPTSLSNALLIICRAPAFVGICGTDLHKYSSPTFIPSKKHPHLVTGESIPVGFGHEFSGTVVEIGSKVQNKGGLKVGDHVAVQPTICCFQCPSCKQNFLNCCDKGGFVGLSGGGGGLSDFVCVDSSFVHKLPANVPLDVGGIVISSRPRAAFV